MYVKINCIQLRSSITKIGQLHNALHWIDIHFAHHQNLKFPRLKPATYAAVIRCAINAFKKNNNGSTNATTNSTSINNYHGATDTIILAVNLSHQMQTLGILPKSAVHYNYLLDGLLHAMKIGKGTKKEINEILREMKAFGIRRNTKTHQLLLENNYFTDATEINAYRVKFLNNKIHPEKYFSRGRSEIINALISAYFSVGKKELALDLMRGPQQAGNSSRIFDHFNYFHIIKECIRNNFHDGGISCWNEMVRAWVKPSRAVFHHRLNLMLLQYSDQEQNLQHLPELFKLYINDKVFIPNRDTFHLLFRVSSENISLLKYFFQEFHNSKNVTPNWYSYYLVGRALVRKRLYDDLQYMLNTITQNPQQINMAKLCYQMVLSVPKNDLEFNKNNHPDNPLLLILKQALDYSPRNTLKLVLEANMKDLTEGVHYDKNLPHWFTEIFGEFKSSSQSITFKSAQESLFGEVVDENKLAR